MKNLKNLGKILTKSEQEKLLGGKMCATSAQCPTSNYEPHSYWICVDGQCTCLAETGYTC